MDTRKECLLNRTGAHMSSHRGASSQATPIGEGGHEDPFLENGLLTADGCQERENQCLPSVAIIQLVMLHWEATYTTVYTVVQT